jgi:hypothetical protein
MGLDLQKRVDKLNKRVGFEWDAFMKVHGENWDSFTEEEKQLATELSIKQSERFKNETKDIAWV